MTQEAWAAGPWIRDEVPRNVICSSYYCLPWLLYWTVPWLYLLRPVYIISFSTSFGRDSWKQLQSGLPTSQWDPGASASFLCQPVQLHHNQAISNCAGPALVVGAGGDASSLDEWSRTCAQREEEQQLKAFPEFHSAFPHSCQVSALSELGFPLSLI